MSIKVAILGAGYMGEKHAKAVRKYGGDVVAVCDMRMEAAQRLAEKAASPGAETYTDFDDMLAHCAFDALFICLPPFAQTGQFEKAARAGKHIFIEKPIALRSAAGAAMVQAAKDAGIVTYVGFHMRKGAALKRLAELMKNGETGRPVLFTGQYACNSLHGPWWRDADKSGGQVFEQAIHIYDSCRFFLGDPGFASGLMGNLCHADVDGYTAEDVSGCIAGFVNGAVATLSATNCAIPNQWRARMTVVFEKLVAEIADHDNAVITFTQGDGRTETVMPAGDAYDAEVEEFLACVREHRPAGCDILEGYKSLCFVETVVRSAKLGGKKLAVAGAV